MTVMLIHLPRKAIWTIGSRVLQRRLPEVWRTLLKLLEEVRQKLVNPTTCLKIGLSLKRLQGKENLIKY